jgi:hypothetical protein
MEAAVADRKISIHFRQYQAPDGAAAVEKDASDGLKHRYLTGIATGLRKDLNGERVTENCIRSIVRQAEAGDVLLYTDVHGIKASEDIGILAHFEVRPDGDWYVEFRLYDASDKIGPEKLETIDTIWRQVNGRPPYTKPRKKGFSIEGTLPPDLIKMREDQKVLDDIHLDGVLLVPQPAYEDSVAHAVYKALGLEMPHQFRAGVRELFEQRVEKDRVGRTYTAARYDLDQARDEKVEQVMGSDADDKEARIRTIYEEYGQLSGELVLKSAALFGQDDSEGTDEASPYSAGSTRAERLRELRDLVNELLAAHGGVGT